LNTENNDNIVIKKIGEPTTIISGTAGFIFLNVDIILIEYDKESIFFNATGQIY